MRSLALLLAFAPPALAASNPTQAGPTITLNGVNIGGVVNQRFENVTVVIDPLGNLDIQAKGYVARLAGAPASPVPPALAPPPAPVPAAPAVPSGPASAGNATLASAAPAPVQRLTRRYFLATEQSQPDASQYDVEVFINASWIRVIRSADPQVVAEVTRYLRPGANKLTLSCTKKAQGGERRPAGPEATLRVVVGAGNVGGDHVMIDDPLAVMTRSAAEVDDKVEEFVFEAR